MIVLVAAQLMFMKFVRHFSFELGKVTIYDKEKESEIYKVLVNKYPPSHFMGLPLADKCEAYFDELSRSDEYWEMSDLSNMEYNTGVLNPHEYFEFKLGGLKQEYAREGRNVDDINTAEITKDLNARLAMNSFVEKRLIDSVSHLRVYGTCYIVPEESARYQKCFEVESRLFPWFTFESPVFERWDGTIVNEFPRISRYYNYEGEGDPNFKPKTSNCPLAEFRNQFNGKGIVLSIDDRLIPEALKFVKHLRFLKNELPVQFIHKGDLSEESKEKLIKAARFNIVVKDTTTVRDYKQEIWFVDTKRCIQEDHFDKFHSFRNKWLAALFNSFEEMILMDTDVVTFMPPLNYFKLSGYRDTGAYFFRDRETEFQNVQLTNDLIHRLMPKDLETLFFGIPQVTELTWDRKYFKERLFHYMESGVVPMNRKTHLLGLLIATQLQFWDPIASAVHGDKELFWLGQSFAGDENYYFNPNPAAAIGAVKKDEYKIANVIIGTQPAHIAPDNETVFWVNSGLETCKKHSWDVDFENKFRLAKDFETKEALKEYYMSPLDIQAAIIPPNGLFAFNQDPNEPDRGWRQLEHYGCQGYLWGGFSKVGGDETTNPDSIGKEIIFPEEDRLYYNSLSKFWVNPDYYFEDDEELSEALIYKYWQILDKFESVEEYEKALNEGRSSSKLELKWDDNTDLTLLEKELSSAQLGGSSDPSKEVEQKENQN